MRPHRRTAAMLGLLGLLASGAPAAQADWEPTRPIEFIVPAGTGGGADQMARVIQAIVTKHNLTPTSMLVFNKATGAGSEGFLDIKAARGNPHKLIITLSNLFTTPLSTGAAFSWKDLTPVAMMALDEFVLWVNADSPHQTTAQFLGALASAPPGQLRMGGTGLKQEDQIITVAIERLTGAKITYVPFHGGGEVATQLVGGAVDATVNNPIEARVQWRAGKVRPLCVFDKDTLPDTGRIADEQGWNDIPTCVSQGLGIEYLMLRGIFMAPAVTSDQVDYYVALLARVRETPEWRQLMRDGAFNQTFLTGKPFAAWLETEEQRHRDLMKAAGFLAGN